MSKEPFRFKIKRIQMFMRLFESGWKLGITGTYLRGFDVDDLYIPGFYNIEIGFLFGTVTINIDDKKRS